MPGTGFINLRPLRHAGSAGADRPWDTALSDARLLPFLVLDPLDFSAFFSVGAPLRDTGHDFSFSGFPSIASTSRRRIGQIMAKVGWRKIGIVMRYAGVNNIEATNSPSTPQIGITAERRPQG